MTTFNSHPAPKSTPWGMPDHLSEIAPGIWEVGTPRHGGLWLSPERRAALAAAVPDYLALAMPEAVQGFFEEDCDYQIVAGLWPYALSVPQGNEERERVAHECRKAVNLKRRTGSWFGG